jgi:hypothetical protein
VKDSCGRAAAIFLELARGILMQAVVRCWWKKREEIKELRVVRWHERELEEEGKLRAEESVREARASRAGRLRKAIPLRHWLLQETFAAWFKFLALET